MAINYSKVGWDTTKYVNPTNMNHMDDGIKAAADGVDALNAARAFIAGERMDIGLIVYSGNVAADAKTISFTVFTPKSSIGLSADLSGTLYIRGVAGSIASSYSIDNLVVSVRKQTENAITFQLSKPDDTAFGAQANTPCVVTFSSGGRITFS